MNRLRVLCPDAAEGLTERVLSVLRAEPGAVHVVRLHSAAVDPAGDVVEADVAREAVDELLESLRALGCAEHGGMVLETLDTVVSAAADRAEAASPGEGVDAVVWDELLARTGSQARLSVTFVVMLTIACLLGAIGVVTNSPVTVVGAMVLGPEFGPLAALAVAAVRRDGALARTASVALGAGFAIALVVTALAAAVADGMELLPEDTLTDLSGVEFVYHVGPLSLVVALLAGVAGMVALVAGEGSGVLVGVFISVTTVPAAGFAAVAVVLADWPRAASSLGQLVVNVVGIVLAGVVVLLIVRASRRRRGVAESLPRDGAGG